MSRNQDPFEQCAEIHAIDEEYRFLRGMTMMFVLANMVTDKAEYRYLID